MRMAIVDAHQHYWRLSRGDYAWLGASQPLLYRDFNPEHLSDVLSDCNVVSTVVVQAAATESETRYLQQLAHSHASIAGVVGWTDFEARDVAARMRALVQDARGKLKGFRPMIQDIPDPDWLSRRTIDVAFDTLVEADLSFDALIKPVHIAALQKRLKQYPTLRVAVDHAAKPAIAQRSFQPWADLIAGLAEATSVYCKLSGLLSEAAVDVTAADLDPFVAHIFKCFGSHRVMWGSDWPVVTERTSYREWLVLATELVARHAPGQERAVFAGNASRFYRLII